MERHIVPSWLARLDLAPGPGIAPFWRGIAHLLGFAPKTPVADGPVGLTMMRHVRLRRCAMTIVPWGVIIGAARGWPEIVQIVHESVAQAPGKTELGWPRSKSFLYVDIDGERFQCVCDFQPRLDDLSRLARTYAAETERLLSLDVRDDAEGGSAGPRVVEQDSGEAFSSLLRASRRLLSSDYGRELFDIEASGYRSTARRVRPAGVERLKSMLVQQRGGPDTAPLAAIVAAELGADELVEPIMVAALSPSPLVTAICRAAAVRLGVSTSRFRRWRELAAFLDDDEVRLMDSWSKGSRIERRAVHTLAMRT